MLAFRLIFADHKYGGAARLCLLVEVRAAFAEMKFFRLSVSVLHISRVCVSPLLSANCRLLIRGVLIVLVPPVCMSLPVCIPPSFFTCRLVSWDIVIALFLLWILSSLSSGLPLPTFFSRSLRLLCGSRLFYFIFFLCHSGSSVTHVSRFTWPGPFMKWTNKPGWQWSVSGPAGYI